MGKKSGRPDNLFRLHNVKFGKRKKSIHSATIVENIDKKILIYRLHSLDTLIGCRYNYIDK